jgi:uncharacterized protein
MRTSLLERYINGLLGHGKIICTETNCVGNWFSINPDGGLMPCGRDWQEDMYFGNISEVATVTEIKRHPNYCRFITLTSQLVKKCQNECPFFEACCGGCFGNVYNHNRDFANPEPNHCISTKIILKHIFNCLKNVDLNHNATKYNPIFKKLLIDAGFRNMHFVKNLKGA